MEMMQEPVQYGCRQDADGNDGDKTAVKGVKTCEQLSPDCVELSYGSHAAKDHRGVDVGIDPRHPFVMPVADDADYERHDNEDERKHGRSERAPEELEAGK